MNTDEPIGGGAEEAPPNAPNESSTVQPQPRRQERARRGVRWWIPVTIGSGCLCLLIPLLLIVTIIGIASGGEPTTGDRIALIHVDGVISGGGDSGLLGDRTPFSERLISTLEKARKDEDIRAVVLRINSPGGSASASEEIYNEILRVRRKKPVYASMSDVAASGGYYIASACNRIYANGATITGSIGVIMEATDLSGLFKKIGVSPEVVKSGKYKDMGNPARPLTPEERQLIQGMIDDTFNQFIDAVSSGRKMPRSKVKELATGRVFTGRQALKLGLVDRIGGLHEAEVDLSHDVGLRGEPKVQKYDHRGGLLGALGSDASEQYQSRQYEMLLDRLVKRLASQENSIESIR